MTEPAEPNERGADLVIGDPLTSVTRRERRNLLATSGIGLVLAKGTLIPSKIDALGIQFTDASQTVIRVALAILIVYFGMAFLLYGASDFVAWRLVLNSRIRHGIARHSRRLREFPPDQGYERVPEMLPSERRLIWLTRPLSIVRAVFEFALPLLVGIYAAVVLLGV
jgi:hypothetical protein